MTDFSAARTAMVDSQVRPSDVTRFPIIDAMLRVPREDYLPGDRKSVAYAGEHIEIAPSRVVLDPRVFAKMLDALDIGPKDLVLDVGCGLGYSSAVISRMAEAVIALEELKELAQSAEELLSEHGCDNAVVERGPLNDGMARHGSFDAIVIEGAVETIPDTFAAQLKVGGRIAAIFADGPAGQARLGKMTASGIAWRRIFDATAPVLPGFEAPKAFVF